MTMDYDEDDHPSMKILKVLGWGIGILFFSITFYAFYLSYTGCKDPYRTGINGTACEYNLKNIGTGLEMYFSDNNGYYPATLSKIAPDYLKEVPGCQKTGHFTGIPLYPYSLLLGKWVNCKDTYSSGYLVNMNTQTYTVNCSGTNHVPGTAPNYPEYTSNAGLIQKP